MWIIIKYKKNELILLSKELRNKIGLDCKIYLPKFSAKKFKNNKLINYEINLLGDYAFFFHKSFEYKESFSKIKFVKGLKYILQNFHQSQNEIKMFINKCKEFENGNGYLSKNFFDLEIKKKYKFSSGPFADKIFQIINLNKNKIKVLIGDIKTTIKKDNYLYSSI